MSALSDLAPLVQDRLEEPRGAGIFWSGANEILPDLVEALNEATLITGEPEIRSTAVTSLALNTNFQTMPAGAVALLRVEGPGGLAISKVMPWDLDNDNPTWENDTDVSIGDQAGSPRYWFPLGMAAWGIYPKLTSGAQVILTYVGLPITASPPWTGSEVVPFQEEYLQGFADMAASVCRVKEGGAELQQGLAVYQRFLSRMEEASRFALRKGSLRFSRVFGPMAAITEVTER